MFWTRVNFHIISEHIRATVYNNRIYTKILPGVAKTENKSGISGRGSLINGGPLKLTWYEDSRKKSEHLYSFFCG